jgi:hypothetical protein
VLNGDGVANQKKHNENMLKTALHKERGDIGCPADGKR